MSTRARIRFVNDSLSLVNGGGTREAIRDLTGRSPVWATISKGWVLSPHTAKQLIAYLEHRGYDITIEGGSDRDRDLHRDDDHQGADPQPEPEAGGLW